jgi:hypothetical protein
MNANLKNRKKKANFSITTFAYCSSGYFCHALAIVQSFSYQAKSWPRQEPTISTVIMMITNKEFVSTRTYTIYTLALL